GLPLERLLDLAIPLSDALAAAHARGVNHRDLKPGNVMVTAQGRVKVLDFGLAKLTAPQSDPELTLTAGLTYTGQILGTAAYISPEQAEGREVDARSDFFALGAVLYKRATGRPAFDGASAAAGISEILRDTPPAVSDLIRAMPVELSKIIQRCLQKEPEKRYASAAEVHAALRALQAPRAPAPVAKLSRRTWIFYGGAVTLVVLASVIGFQRFRSLPQPSPPTPAPGSIAVLPFVNMSGDADQEYFSDGVSEELMNLLARIPE